MTTWTTPTTTAATTASAPPAGPSLASAWTTPRDRPPAPTAPASSAVPASPGTPADPADPGVAPESQVLSLRMDSELFDRLQDHAAKRGMSVQDYVVRTLIRDDFDERFKASVDETERFYGNPPPGGT